MLTESDFITSEWVGCGGLHMVQPCEAIIQAAFPNNSALSLLDAGCGCGAIGLSLMRAGVIHELVMTDIDTASVDYARANTDKLLTAEQRRHVRTYLADGWQTTNEPLPEPPLDVIVCNAPMSAQPPADGKVNPYRFWTDNWDFQRKLFSRLDTYLRPAGIVIIKDLFGSTWWRDFPVTCALTVVGDAPTLQRSPRLFTSGTGSINGSSVFEPITGVRLSELHHCLRVFRQD